MIQFNSNDNRRRGKTLEAGTLLYSASLRPFSAKTLFPDDLILYKSMGEPLDRVLTEYTKEYRQIRTWIAQKNAIQLRDYIQSKLPKLIETLAATAERISSLLQPPGAEEMLIAHVNAVRMLIDDFDRVFPSILRDATAAETIQQAVCFPIVYVHKLRSAQFVPSDQLVSRKDFEETIRSSASSSESDDQYSSGGSDSDGEDLEAPGMKRRKGDRRHGRRGNGTEYEAEDGGGDEDESDQGEDYDDENSEYEGEGSREKKPVLAPSETISLMARSSFGPVLFADNAISGADLEACIALDTFTSSYAAMIDRRGIVDVQYAPLSPDPLTPVDPFPTEPFLFTSLRNGYTNSRNLAARGKHWAAKKLSRLATLELLSLHWRGDASECGFYPLNVVRRETGIQEGTLFYAIKLLPGTDRSLLPFHRLTLDRAIAARADSRTFKKRTASDTGDSNQIPVDESTQARIERRTRESMQAQEETSLRYAARLMPLRVRALIVLGWDGTPDASDFVRRFLRDALPKAFRPEQIVVPQYLIASNISPVHPAQLYAADCRLSKRQAAGEFLRGWLAYSINDPEYEKTFDPTSI